MKIVSWLNNLKLATKMLIIGVFALLGLILPTYFYVTLSLESQATAEQELTGVPPIIQTVKLMKITAEHRGMSARLFGGDDSAASPLGTKGLEVDQAFSSLNRYLKDNVNDADVTMIFSQAQNHWQTLKNSVSSRSISGAESFREHSEVIIKLGSVISKLMQMSSLSYDPAASSYHLIIANFENLPRLTDALGQVRGFGAGVLSRGVISPAERASLEAKITVLNVPYRDFIANLQAAAASDDSFSSLESDANNFQNKINHLEALVKAEILEADVLTYNSGRFFDESSAIINDAYGFFDEAVVTLEGVIVDRAENISSERNLSLTLIFILLIIGGGIGFLVIRSINNSVGRLSKAFTHISSGKYDFKFDTKRKDEMGQLNVALSDLNNELEKADVVAIEAMRVKQALENSSTCFMIANNDRDIIYLNASVKAMLNDCEADLKEVLPQFNASKVLGQKMDIFHKNPEHQRSLLENLRQKYETQIKVGKRHFRLMANPVHDDKGERLGTVIEWLDRTKEVQAEAEIGNMVESALQGDFSVRVDASDKDGFLLSMTEGLNQLQDITEQGLSDVSEVLMAISEGDLTKRVDADYQGTFEDLKNYCNTTSTNLTDIIGEIREASETIYSASTEIARGNSDLSNRTEQQASSLEETASSMEQITGTVRLNAENANQANGLASQASDVAKNGGELIGQVVKTMASINESSQKIADIIGVIDGIAFQTNILALNAAVEAARAGEQGRGFAVVASEVRTLAQRSANAAKDIKDLISDSVSKIENGNTLVNQSGETMQEIVTSIQRVNDIMSEIAAASAEQASGIDEVGKAVTQMDEMTQQNAALVEEAAAAAEKMSQQAEQLSGRVGAFKLDENAQPTKSTSTQNYVPKLDSPARSKSAEKILPPVSDDDDEWESF
ncbi:MAG: hypothetical protein Alis3KO_24460 [Aliiglaciecola sp.]